MIKKLLSAFRTLARVLKNLFLRPFKTAFSRIKYFFSAGRLVSAVPGAAKKLPKILKTKPEKREDYFDWGSVYVAKTLVYVIIALIVILPVLYIFLLHPLLTSWFWVKDFTLDDSALSSYSGKVRVYYDEDHEYLEFVGKLKDGKAINDGEEYYKNGKFKYVGGYVDGAYEGEGILYYDDGSVMYRGGLAAGRYEGVGEYTDENGDVYSGSFSMGKLSGSGTLSKNGVSYYDGSFSDGKMAGEGKLLYSDGTVRFSGNFTDGELNGTAMEYYSNGKIKYNGSFTDGLYNGNGVLYSETGKKLYSGDFDMGQFSGSGTLYDENGVKLYTGEFEDGAYSGSGTLYSADGSVTVGSFAEGQIVGAAERTFPDGKKYEGTFADNLMSGIGTLSDVTGQFSYSGAFLDDDFDYSAIFAADTNTVKSMIPSLSQTVDSDFFYLTDSNFGVAIKCSFATDAASAAAVEIFTRPIVGDQTVIASANDINAPQALEVGEAQGSLPQWAAKEFGVAYDSVNCYAARYSNMTVYFWTNSATSVLVLKSAVPEANSNIGGSGGNGSGGNGGSGSGDSIAESGLSKEEIAALFEELGLDPADFSSLGFDLN